LLQLLSGQSLFLGCFATRNYQMEWVWEYVKATCIGSTRVVQVVFGAGILLLKAWEMWHLPPFLF
jgi:hypothetical protein